MKAIAYVCSGCRVVFPPLYGRHPSWRSSTFTTLTGGDSFQDRDSLFDMFSFRTKLRNHFRKVHSDKCSALVGSTYLAKLLVCCDAAPRRCSTAPLRHEINVTITMLWDGGFDFAFASYMQFPEIGTPADDLESRINPKVKRFKASPWHSCKNANELAEAIHRAALEKYPQLTYAKTYARPN